MKTLIAILVLTGSVCYGQARPPQDSLVVQLSGLNSYKKDFTAAKVMQMLGITAIGTYFFLENRFEKRVEDGNLKAKRPSQIIPIAGSGVFLIGLSLDMGSIDHVLRKRRIQRSAR